MLIKTNRTYGKIKGNAMNKRLFMIVLALAVLMLVQGPAGAAIKMMYLFNDGAGDTAVDSSGYGNHLTLTDDGLYAPTPVWTVGQYSGGLEFDGLDDYGTAALDISMQLKTTATIQCWVYLNNTPPGGSWSTMALKNGNWFIGLTNDLPRVTYYWTDATYTVCYSPTGITPNVWHHVAGTYDGTDIKLYVDGVEVEVVNVPGKTIRWGTQPVYVGRWSAANSYLYGKLDELVVSDVVVPVNELGWYQSYESLLLQVNVGDLPEAYQYRYYEQQLAALGGTSPYSWSIVEGSLPTGLTLSDTGTISGVSTSGDSASFTLQVEDANTDTDTATVTLRVLDNPDVIDMPVAGWHMVGTGIYGDISLLGALVYDGSTTKTIEEAETAGWLQATLYYYDMTEKKYKFAPGDSDVLVREYGYWVWTAQGNLKLILQ
jgi:Concanavalin A-like lectin/glucanases superfamily/Putative Ig domain